MSILLPSLECLLSPSISSALNILLNYVIYCIPYLYVRLLVSMLLYRLYGYRHLFAPRQRVQEAKIYQSGTEYLSVLSLSLKFQCSLHVESMSGRHGDRSLPVILAKRLLHHMKY